MKDSSGCGSVLVLLGLMILIGLVGKGCDMLESKDKESEQKNNEPQIIVDGQTGVFVQQTFVGATEEAYDILSSYIFQENSDAIYDQILRGEVFIGNKGEAVRVLDSGFVTSYIEIVETGYRGYVDAEMVRSKLPD